MKIISEQLCLLFLFVFYGYILGKSRRIKQEHTQILSGLEIYLFLPCTIFRAFSNSFQVENLRTYYPLILISTGVLGVLLCGSYFIAGALGRDGYEKNVFRYSIIVSNYGYMGYALAEGLYGTDGLLRMILFSIPFSFYIYTYGFCMLTGREFSLKKLFNPVTMSIFIGIVFGLSGLSLPAVAETFIAKSAACMAPVSMLLAGITMSEFDAKELISDKRIYLISVVRLVLVPGMVLLFLKPFFNETVVRTAILLCAMPCGMNTIVFPRLVGQDCKAGAKLAFVSSILCIVSIPVLLNLI